jgi:hypothetical protein
MTGLAVLVRASEFDSPGGALLGLGYELWDGVPAPVHPENCAVPSAVFTKGPHAPVWLLTYGCIGSGPC